MNKTAFAPLFYQEIEKILRQTENPEEQFILLYELFSKLIDFLVKEEQFTFTTFFAQIAYIGHKYGLSSQLQYYLHQFRKTRTIKQPIDEHHTALAVKCLILLTQKVFGGHPSEKLSPFLNRPWPFAYQKIQTVQFYPKLRVLAVEVLTSDKQIIAIPENAPEQKIIIQYGVPSKNDLFDDSIQGIQEWIGLPCTLNLVEVSVDENEIHYPNAFVLEPDHLVDVSSISESFKGNRAVLSSYFLKKFWPFQTSIPLLLGNASNYFLDKLLHDPQVAYKTLFKALFRIYPLQLSLFSDGDIQRLYQKASGHYLRLKKVLFQDLPKEGIALETGVIEPSFYAEKYGIQGRLDLFFDDQPTSIIELKSGKIYRPNVYGLGQNHFVQTLLYDLLIQSVYQNEKSPTNYILYSGAEERQLRFAPRIKAQQWEALAFRNQIIILEKRLAQILPTEEGLTKGLEVFGLLSPNGVSGLSSFEKERMSIFEKLLSRLSIPEKAYFLAFSGFIAREHQLSKTGIPGFQHRNGQAALWLETLESKVEKFEILNHLELDKLVDLSEEEQIVLLRRSSKTNKLVNFRIGDVVVLYPHLEDAPGALRHQIFKGTLVQIDKLTVQIRLRSKQSNLERFKEELLWNVEHDMLDSSFTSLYRSLFTWMEAIPKKRALLLGVLPPEEPEILPFPGYEPLTQEQNRILAAMIYSKDYFLLWGPPGTGKTSIMLRYYVKHQLEQSHEQLLILAYTNRAVDEICESIEGIGEHLKDHYLRIGSANSTHPHFRSQLLQSKTGSIQNRKELIELIQNHRIVVGTVASLINKPELFSLKTFDTVIIDEASQILEPYLVGLLPKFKKVILIGDHKQLPAVVLQDEQKTKVQIPELKEIGLMDLGNALFERLFKLCQKNQWSWAFDQLGHQGRMHQDIMQFPAQFFYGKKLSILPIHIPHAQKQTAPLIFQNLASESALVQSLGRERMLFIDTPVDTSNPKLKTNQHEASFILEIIQSLILIRQKNNLDFNPSEIGIITPFRAQIAMIRSVFSPQDEFLNNITIDTVERYQGGARNIIIISLCTNSLDKINTLTSYSDEGVDRKLNVALTRARDQIIILGNRQILDQLPLYKALIDYSTVFIPTIAK